MTRVLFVLMAFAVVAPAAANPPGNLLAQALAVAAQVEPEVAEEPATDEAPRRRPWFRWTIGAAALGWAFAIAHGNKPECGNCPSKETAEDIALTSALMGVFVLAFWPQESRKTRLDLDTLTPE